MRQLKFATSALVRRRVALIGTLTAILSCAPAAAFAAGSYHRSSGDLLVSTSRYREADIQPGVTQLPPGCTSACATVTADGAYPFVFNNDLADPSFGVAAPVILDRISPGGQLIARTKVPTAQLVTSFSSKSEMALNPSTDGTSLTFMSYRILH